ncbi:hypothetical protein HMPREF0262_02856 [Clostridium sp. ATCC 29733]|nr:hypothetical protein HMPREF0262_02856 [Clostridium sp. ATCC 29733]
MLSPLYQKKGCWKTENPTAGEEKIRVNWWGLDRLHEMPAGDRLEKRRKNGAFPPCILGRCRH